MRCFQFASCPLTTSANPLSGKKGDADDDERTRRRLLQEGVSVPGQTMLRVGLDPARQLLKLAESRCNDCVMTITTHGRGYLGPFPTGSVATTMM